MDANTFSGERSMAFFLAMILMSQFWLKCCLFNRKYSRIRRLIRFLCAALPAFRVTVMPSLERLNWPGWIKAIRESFSSLRPDLVISRNCDRFKIRSSFLKEKRIVIHYLSFTIHCDGLSASGWKSHPALNPALTNYPASPFCRHPFAKSVVSGPLEPAGLKSSLHLLSSLYYCILYLFAVWLASAECVVFQEVRPEIFYLNHKL